MGQHFKDLFEDDIITSFFSLLTIEIQERMEDSLPKKSPSQIKT
jgi:hypothetical protein